MTRHWLQNRRHRNDGAATESDSSAAGRANPDEDARRQNGVRWGRVLAYGVLPALALILTLGAGYLKFRDFAARDSQSARTESVRAATDSTIAMLSYRPDTVERDLAAARDRLSGSLKDSYTALTHDVVIPGSRQKQISATAVVPAAASVSASETHAVVLVFVDQTIAMGSDPPSNTASRVRVTLDKVGDRWLIAGFDPI
jgi:Mce-associated membrane protein